MIHAFFSLIPLADRTIHKHLTPLNLETAVRDVFSNCRFLVKAQNEEQK